MVITGFQFEILAIVDLLSQDKADPRVIDVYEYMIENNYLFTSPIASLYCSIQKLEKQGFIWSSFVKNLEPRNTARKYQRSLYLTRPGLDTLETQKEYLRNLILV